MNKEYFLIGYRTTVGKQGYKFIDRIVAIDLRTAKKDFGYRNNFKKLLEKYNLVICEAKNWID